MSIACTFPGKFGDILWALPTVRAISETFGEPVNLIVAEPYGSIVPLLLQQPYIQTAVAFPLWKVMDTAPMTPRKPPIEFNFDRVFDLGYIGWPLKPLPFSTYELGQAQYGGILAPLDLRRPWISVPSISYGSRCVVGFTDEWFELKFGIWTLLSRGAEYRDWLSISGIDGSRWRNEGTHGPSTWVEAAQWIKGAEVFLGCCSALHVLSAALGKTTIVMEPNPNRHHPIFWPFGIDSDQGPVICVKGGDGKPTFDARHVREAIMSRLVTAPITL